MSKTYSNYRWEPTNKRKGDRWHYLRDVTWGFNPHSKPEPQTVATVTYMGDHKHPNWGKWVVSEIRPVSPALNELRMGDKPVFSSKDEAMAWVTAMVRMTI